MPIVCRGIAAEIHAVRVVGYRLVFNNCTVALHAELITDGYKNIGEQHKRVDTTDRVVEGVMAVGTVACGIACA